MNHAAEVRGEPTKHENFERKYIVPILDMKVGTKLYTESQLEELKRDNLHKSFKITELEQKITDISRGKSMFMTFIRNLQVTLDEGDIDEAIDEINQFLGE